ncbi:MAG TPA: sulfur oxidation c-type cytochrome SoxA [Chromatiales bacterium]|nr:sulfur oxidation c-type cytochrome SoxA [Chromatiales bacterium]
MIPAQSRIPRRITTAGLLLALLPVFHAPALPALEPRSGYEFLTPSTQEMQDDEFANPGMVEVEKGKRLFNRIGNNGKTCATCHGKDGEKLDTGKIATYPVYNEEFQEPFTLQMQINLCWEDQLDEVPFIYDCTDLVALETFVRYKARGEKVNVDVSGPLKPYYEAGKELYHMRFGQVDVSCAHCHDMNPGRRLRGQILTQGQTNGFPEYRLGSGRITSLHRRLTECFLSFRAEPFDLGSEEYINLEIYLNARGNGLPIETPAVRY